MFERADRRPARTWIAAAALLLCLASAALYPNPGAAERRAGMEGGNLRAFDQRSVLHGALKPTSRFAYRGRYAAHSTYRGGGANGYARGIFELDWRPGRTVSYSAAFRLPADFYRSMQGQVALMRWDNWPTYEDNGDVGGIVIFSSDHKAYLVRGRYGGRQVTIGRGFRLRAGRWLRIGVQQRLSRSHPRSTVRVNGRKVVSSRARNFAGRPIDRVRFGLVAIGAGAQRKGLDLYFDEARAGTGR